MNPSQDDLRLILYSALQQPIGLLLQVSDFEKARQKFYRARAEANDPALADLQLRSSPGLDGGNLIIVNRRVNISPQLTQQ